MKNKGPPKKIKPFFYRATCCAFIKKGQNKRSALVNPKY